MTLVLIVALPFVGALLSGLAGRIGRNASALAAGAATLAALALLAGLAPAVLRGDPVQARIDWVPALGLNATFLLDGLGLLFAGLILGIGLLILLYARFYLSPRDSMAQFCAFLMLFQGAMTGIVLSDNILLLLVFWELTSLSSFLLIGFWKHLPEGRQGARMALAVTGGGGLAMIAGMLILGQIAGSYDLSVILTQRDAIQASPWYLPALILILLGCFTKSAQFPFHFWLPHAMAAPTPVSAYLHSATMVKAGVFLMARMWPVLAGTDAWFALVATTGMVTMLLGAKVALFKTDLKAVLAYSTVSHLGLITFLLGLGTPEAAAVAVFHILNHATFKAALFMAVGIVDHATHTRDLRLLGGLRHQMPLTFAITGIAALAMAGIPPLNGFLSKEMMLDAAAQASAFGSPWLVGALATLGALLSVAYTVRLVAQGFLGPARRDLPHAPHDPGPGLWAAPTLLVALAVLIGLAPMPVAGWLVDAAAGAVTGAPVAVKISHWHGLQPAALWMSLAAIGGGLVVWGLYPRLARLWDAAPKPEAKRIFDTGLRALAAAARALSDGLHDGRLSRYLAIAVLVIVGLGLYAFAGGTHAPGLRAAIPVQGAPAVGVAVLVAVTLALMLLHRNRVVALMLVGAVGLMIALGFAWFSAPDLALTQAAVEVVTVVLMLLALNYLPKETPRESTALRRLRDLAVAGLAGGAVAALAYALMRRDAAFPPISGFHLAQSKPGAGGTNAVNTIIVDFRGYDTYGEIIVLGIAALVILALTEALLRPGPARSRLLALRGTDRPAGDRHPMMMVVATRFLLPITMLVGVYLFLRGHNLPGGGFVAGLIFAVALVMQYMASGYAWATRRLRFDHHALIGAGVLVATATGLGALAFGLPFLTSGYTYVHLWPLEEFELATAALFDLGVFLCVLGAVMLTLASFARLGQVAGDTAALRPFDTEPARAR